MKGQESQVLNGKEAFELINVFPSLLLSPISLLFWRSGPFWLSLFSLPAFFLFLSWILPWQTSLLPLALLVCGYSTSYSVDLTVSLCCFGCILDPTPSSLPPFVTLEFLQHCFSSPAASVFMNLNNLTFLAKKKKTINETAQPCQTELVTMVIFLHIFCHTQPWVSYLHFWYKCYKWVTDRSSASPPQTLHSELLPTCVRFLSAQTTNKSNEEFSFCTFVTSVYDRDVFAYVKEHVCVHKSCTWRLFFCSVRRGVGGRMRVL